MSKSPTHPYIPELKDMLLRGNVSRREFLRTSTLLGLSAGAAYGFARQISGEGFITQALAAETPKTGGTLRVSMLVQEMTDPATFDWVRKSNVARQFLEYVTMTGSDNVTRPYLAERWEASDDLKTWTFYLRKGIRWSNGEELKSDHVIFNTERWLDPNVGSSVQGLLKSMVTENADGSTQMTEGAVEKIDDYTFRLNLNKSELAIPEAFYHYPAAIMHPASIEDGKADVSKRPIGTGPFKLTEFRVAEKAVLERNPDFWGGPEYLAGGPYLDRIVYLDHGEDTSAHFAAIASGQVDMLHELPLGQIDVVAQVPSLRLLEAVTAQTAVARMQADQEPFTDQRVRNALQACMDHEKLLEIVYRGRGAVAEDHHCAPIHPEYAPLPKRKQDYALAKQLLADAGISDGLELTLDVNASEKWEVNASQAMFDMTKPGGIELKLNIMPGAQYWEIWDKTPFGLTGWAHRPLGVMVYNLAYRTGAPWNESHHSNPEFDQMLDAANATLDPNERRKQMEKLELMLQENGAITQTLWRSIFAAANENVRGFELHPTQYHQMFHVWMA